MLAIPAQCDIADLLQSRAVDQGRAPCRIAARHVRELCYIRHAKGGCRTGERPEFAVRRLRAARISIGGEAINEPGAARLLERILAAAGGPVRGVPGLHVAGILEADHVVMTDDGRAVAVLGPVATRGVAT